MTDLQARISGVVLNRLADYGIRIDREVSDSVADAMLSIPGTVTVELPEADEDGDFRYGPYRGYLSAVDGEVIGKWGANYDGPDLCREFAAALLAAAIAAEVGQ